MYSKLTAGLWLMLLLSVVSCSNTPKKVAVVQTTAPTIESVTFNLIAGSLETNLRRLLGKHGDYQHIYWNVSQRHQVVAVATVTADDLYQLIDKIIAPYKKPSQIRATFYRANGVVTFDYNRLMDKHHE